MSMTINTVKSILITNTILIHITFQLFYLYRKNGISKVFDSSSSMGNCSSPDILPLRRSRREKTLVYANFTPEEINNTIQKKHLVEAFSEVALQ